MDIWFVKNLIPFLVGPTKRTFIKFHHILLSNLLMDFNSRSVLSEFSTVGLLFSVRGN